MDQSFDSDLKDVTFSKYFNKSNISMHLATRPSPIKQTVPATERYEELSLGINEARFINLNKKNALTSSYVLISYGTMRYQTTEVQYSEMNPKYTSVLNIPLSYNGSLIFPETIELSVFSSNISQSICMGKSMLSIRQLQIEKCPIKDWFCLVDQKQITGSILLSFQFIKQSEPRKKNSPREMKTTLRTQQLSAQYSPIIRVILYCLFQKYKIQNSQMSKPIEPFDLSKVSGLDKTQQMVVIEQQMDKYQQLLVQMKDQENSTVRGHQKPNSTTLNYFSQYYLNEQSNYNNYYSESLQQKRSLSQHSQQWVQLNINKIKRIRLILDALEKIRIKTRLGNQNISKQKAQIQSNNIEFNKLTLLTQQQEKEVQQLKQQNEQLCDKVQQITLDKNASWLEILEQRFYKRHSKLLDLNQKLKLSFLNHLKEEKQKLSFQDQNKAQKVKQLRTNISLN